MGKYGRRTATIVAMVGLTLSACSGDDSDDATPVITDPVETTESTTSTSSSTSTTVDPDAAVEAEVEEAYLAYWDAFLEIYSLPRPNNPLIERHTAGAVRDATLDTITDLVLNGESIRPPEDPAHWDVTVLDVEVDGDRAHVDACLVDGARYYDNAADTPINDDVFTKRLDAVMVREDGQWKAYESQIVERREGVWDCAS